LTDWRGGTSAHGSCRETDARNAIDPADYRRLNPLIGLDVSTKIFRERSGLLGKKKANVR
jgi:hypothetical protein